MTRIAIGLMAILFAAFLWGCGISRDRFEEVSAYVLANMETLSAITETTFFTYETSGISVGGVYYGYYYTEENRAMVPDFYAGGNLGNEYEEDGGTYFGQPNSGTDWCFVKQITDHWFYYELHWA